MRILLKIEFKKYYTKKCKKSLTIYNIYSILIIVVVVIKLFIFVVISSET